MHHPAHAHAHHGPSPALYRFGVWLLIASEAMFFVALLTTRFVLAGTERPEVLNQPLGVAMTAILLGSGIPAWRAGVAAARGDRRATLANLWLTALLGALFLVLMAYEWSVLLRELPAGSPYGTAFYATTGMHGAHVFFGVLAYIAMALRTRAGELGPHNHAPIEGAERYWHFVDVAWLFIYPIFYLIG
ncbi:cytochrome c oxidase subunit III [Thermaerobacter marianensis DSM 12885]|uniref:Cytochrome c oxidase subunit III n=1 Tax=Thermaerobacter marianensis (strain ATCC 700841 / DSM 12885 / JCM 10246 / 7p75a) TaxID=644966 RepID=E6SH42_THEM7|nr:cytochrome c oxidase subunit 3 [Thermaerobacter marianensis]ADU51706.1 cytochrome c oxidase subunit III [Thermaerobacter marianensis DSM 12885]